MVHAMMPEGISATTLDTSAILQNRQVEVEGNTAERHEDAKIGKEVELGFEPSPAVVQLPQGRFVIGRRAMDCGRDAGIMKLQPVVSGMAFHLAGEAGFIEDAVEPFARAVA